MAVSRETARTIIGVIGNIISLGLFLSPVPTFAKIWKAKSVQSFKPDPYVATILNCMLWSFYGMPFIKADSLLVLSINAVGFVIEIIYITIFILYSDWPKKRKIFIAIAVEVVFVTLVVFVTMIFLHGDARANFIGVLCLIFNIIMYASPLTVMKRVISTKSVKFMPFYLSLASFLNGSIWFTFALLKFDPWVLIPNGLGAFSGLVQLVLYGMYYRTTNWDEEEKPGQVQMSEDV